MSVHIQKKCTYITAYIWCFRDGTRAFALHKEWGGCPNDKAWMEILDHPNGGQPCSWDKNVRNRPYFLYSNTGGWALCQRS